MSWKVGMWDGLLHLFTLPCLSSSSHLRSKRLHFLLLLVLWTLLPVTLSCSQKLRLKLDRKRFNEVLHARNEVHMFWQGRVGVLSQFQRWNLPMSALTGDIGAAVLVSPLLLLSFIFHAYWKPLPVGCYLHIVSCVFVSIASECKSYF
jgi:hypothetical protein